jgi:hypothetical protein
LFRPFPGGDAEADKTVRDFHFLGTLSVLVGLSMVSIKARAFG